MSILDVAERTATAYERKFKEKKQASQIEAENGSTPKDSVRFTIYKLKENIEFRLNGGMDREIEQILIPCEDFLEK